MRSRNTGFSLFFLLTSLPLIQAQDNIQVTPDIVYATYGPRQLKLDVYRPRSSKPRRVGDKQGFAPIARKLAAQGFVAACIEYRVLGKNYGINTDAIGAIGCSAGGHPGVSSRVQAVVAMAPVTDFATTSKSEAAGGHAVRTMFQSNIELANSSSPLTYLAKDSGSILFIHGDADKTVPISQAAFFFHEVLGN